MFTIGLALFTVMSAACGLAPNATALVVARALQGAAGAMLTPQVLAILGTTYEGRRRDRAFAAYGFAMGIAGVFGQLLGGALIQADLAGLGWRTIYNSQTATIITVAGSCSPAWCSPRCWWLSTAQQVGGAVGVAGIGVAFFGGGTIVHAFVVSLYIVAGLTVFTAVLAQLLCPAR